jgi:hypothetical protein
MSRKRSLKNLSRQSLKNLGVRTAEKVWPLMNKFQFKDRIFQIVLPKPQRTATLSEILN